MEQLVGSGGRGVVVGQKGTLAVSALYSIVKTKRAKELCDARSGVWVGKGSVITLPLAMITHAHWFSFSDLHNCAGSPRQSSDPQSGAVSGQHTQPFLGPLPAHCDWPLSPPQ